MLSRLSDVWVGGAIAVFGAIVLLVLIPFGLVEPEGIPARAISPAFWPKATGWMLVAFGVIIALEGIWKPSEEVGGASDAASSSGGSGLTLLRAGLGFVLLYAIWIMIGWIGLPAASGAIILLFGALFGERRYSLLAAVAVLLPLALYYFFSGVAGVPIPVGSLFE